MTAQADLDRMEECLAGVASSATLRGFPNTAAVIEAAPGLIAEVRALREALEPFARLIPGKQYNAGAYSIRFDDIERARAALSLPQGEK